MGQIKKDADRSRRDFISLFIGKDSGKNKTEKKKMLTADGKLVEVGKEIFDQVKRNQRASNREIYNWMNNPSKENNS